MLFHKGATALNSAGKSERVAPCYNPTNNRHSIGKNAMTTKRGGLLDTYFYFFMSLLIATVVVYGFGQTVGGRLIHPDVPRPFLLYVHAAAFSLWVVFYIFQSALVRTRNVWLHRRLGWFGAGLGVVMLGLGISTAITMSRFDILHYHQADAAAFLIVALFDIFAFSVPLALAIYWRKRPEFHRRLVLVACCALTSAAFGRFPPKILPLDWSFIGVDVLILLGVARDLIVNRRIHPVYLFGVPAFLFCQIFAWYTYLHNSPYWLRIAHAILD
jgi:hypothetical protein